MNVAKLREHVKYHGPLRTALAYSFGLLRRFFDFDIMRVESAGGGPTRSSVIKPYVTREVTAYEYGEGVKGLEGDHERPWAFDRGDLCIANFLGDEMVGYTFYTISTTPVRPGIIFRFPDTLVYTYGSYVTPAHRGNRLAVARANHRREVEQSRGISRNAVYYIAVDNFASRASSRQMEPTLIGYVAYLRLGRRHFFFSSPGSKRTGVRLTQEGG